MLTFLGSTTLAKSFQNSLRKSHTEGTIHDTETTKLSDTVLEGFLIY